MIDLHLSSDVRRVLQTVSCSEKSILVELPEELGLLRWETESIELVLVVLELDRALPEGTLRRTWQTASIDSGCTEKFGSLCCSPCTVCSCSRVYKLVQHFY